MTLREALADVLGHALLERLTATLGTEWAVLAAYSRIEATGAWTEGARALDRWPERRDRAWDAVSKARPG